MDNREYQGRPEEDGILDERLTAMDMGQEITADESAMLSAGLTDPAQLEVPAAPIVEETESVQEPEAVTSDLAAFDDLMTGEPTSEAAAENAPVNIFEDLAIPAENEAEVSSDLGAFDDLMDEPPAERNEDLAPQAELDVSENPAEITEPKELPDELENAPVIFPEGTESPFQESTIQDAFGDGDEFQQIFDASKAPKEPEPIPTRDRPTRKGRPKRKKGDGLFGIPHLLATAIWIVLILVIGISLGRMVWVCAADVLAFGREDMEITVTIDEGDTMEDVAEKLHNAGLVRYPGLFEIYADLANADEKITSGTYTLNTLFDYNALVKQMSPSSSTRIIVKVTIPEGYNCRQIFELLAENKVCTVEALEEAAANGELKDYWFLDGLERGSKYCLEGYLFPDTYEFYVNDKPIRVLEKMLNNFDRRFSDDMREKLDVLNQRLAEKMEKNGYDEAFINDNLMTIHDVVTVASLIEKETADNLESYAISGVIYNRLCNRREYPYLNIDATVLYALGEHKEALTYEDLQVDSPYNTYVTRGLPAGPISNPGLASLGAALDPDDSSYYYYVYDPDQGVHLFSKNQAEHDQKVAKIRAAQEAKKATEETEGAE